MRNKLTAVLAMATLLAACTQHKPEVRQTFNVCAAHDGSALVSINGKMIGYDYADGFNGQPKYRPHDGSDITHPAFMEVGVKTPDNGRMCEEIIGRVID